MNKDTRERLRVLYMNQAYVRAAQNSFRGVLSGEEYGIRNDRSIEIHTRLETLMNSIQKEIEKITGED